MTIMTTTFIPCSAKLPIYAFFVSAFFPKNGAYVMIMLYLVGIIFGILIALLYKKILFKGEAVPFVMELPNYRFPRVGNIARLLWAKAKDFLERAFTVILVATLIIWILQSIDFNFHMVVDSEDSMLAVIAGAFAVIMKPVGLGSWQICTSLISGFMAKESVVSTLAVLFDGDVTQGSHRTSGYVYADLLPPLHPVCSCNRRNQEGAGNQVGCQRSILAVPCGMACLSGSLSNRITSFLKNFCS